jgi:hypothetical protein
MVTFVTAVTGGPSVTVVTTVTFGTVVTRVPIIKVSWLQRL